MMLTCPQCAARYNVKDEAFPAEGRKVRCTKCGHSWFQPAPPVPAPQIQPEPEAEPVPDATAAPAPEPLAEPAPVAPDRAQTSPTAEVLPAREPAPDERPARRGRIALAAGWALLLLAILLLAWSAVRYRTQVVGSWPRAASLYAWIGWPVNASGIAFSDVHYKRLVRNGHNVLAVTGTLVNLSGQLQKVPPVRLVLRGARGKVLYRFVFAPPVPELKAGEQEVFRTSLADPPQAARHLTLELAGAAAGQ